MGLEKALGGKDGDKVGAIVVGATEGQTEGDSEGGRVRVALEGLLVGDSEVALGEGTAEG